MADVHTSLRSTGWVSLCSFGQLVIQFVFQLLLAKYFGASEDMDAFVAAMALPTVLSSIFLGSLGYAFVPLFTEQLDRGDGEQAWAMAGSIGLLLVAVAGSLSLLTFLFARPLTTLLYPGFSGERFERTVDLLRILGWLVLANGLITYLQTIYHCHRRFVIPGMAAVVGTGATLVTVIALRQQGIVAVGWAVLVGSLIAILLQLPLPVAHLRYGGFRTATGRCVRLMMPLILGAAYYRLDPLVDRYLASALPSGSISHLGYAWRLVAALLLVGTGSLSVVAFPNFARHWAAGRKGEFCAEVAFAMRFLVVMLVPMVAAILCYHEPLIQDVFERGMFTASDTKAVALLLVMYLGVLVGGGVGEIASKAFYAFADTRTPVIVGSVGFTLGLILKVLLVPISGAAGIALATSFYYLFNAGFMSGLVMRRLGTRPFVGTAAALRRSLVAAGAAASAAYPIIRLELPLGAILALAVGGSVYLMAMLVQRDEFALKLWWFLMRRTPCSVPGSQPATSQTHDGPAKGSR
jgi:putative peptidoglycan lipid II flippase